MGVFNNDGDALTREKIRVCAFNVGNFAQGASGDPDGTDALYNKFVSTFRECNADIYMFSEWDPNWNASETSSSVFGFLKPYHSTYLKPDSGGGYTGQMNYSGFSFGSEYYEYFTHDTGRYFIDNVIEINGKTIHLICTHLTFTTGENALAEIQQILDYISDNGIASYIIGGDMNFGLHKNDGTEEVSTSLVLEEIALFESLGGTSIQGSGWGLKNRDFLFNTVLHRGYEPSSGNGFGPFDDIIVSPDISINSAGLVITEASDHDVVYADLEIN